MPSEWIKQPQQLNQVIYLNSGSGDSVQGGAINSLPSGVPASQGIQNQPGDRMILGEADANALDDPAVGTLYGGVYQYVRTKSTSTAAFTRAHAAFWDVAVAASQYQVTADEDGAQGVALFAGVMINTITKGNLWWIQCAGRVSVQFKAALTGAPADGGPVYLGAVGAGEPGVFDVLDGGGNPTFTQVGQMLERYVGVAQAIPVAGAISTVNIPLGRVFRW